MSNTLTDKHFYRTVVEIEILSEWPIAFKGLDQIHYAITEGDCSGDWTVKSHEEVTPEKMAELLLAQGSDPGFFGLDEPQVCTVCGKPAEGEDACQCVCPTCGANCFDDVDIGDHGECRDCHHAGLNEEREGEGAND